MRMGTIANCQSLQIRREPHPQHPVSRGEAKTRAFDSCATASWCRSAMISKCLALANSWEGQSVSRDPASVGRNAAHRTWAA